LAATYLLSSTSTAGATVVIGCRHVGKGKETTHEIKRIRGVEKIYYKFLDLANMDSVAEFAEDVCRGKFSVIFASQIFSLYFQL